MYVCMYVGASCIFGYYVIKWPPCQKPVRGLNALKTLVTLTLLFTGLTPKTIMFTIYILLAISTGNLISHIFHLSDFI